MAELLGGLAGATEPVLLVLDDAHRLHDAAALQVLTSLVEHLPSRVRVIIAGREAPALPFPRWLAEEVILRLGPDDLAMTDDEATRLLTRRGAGLAPAAVRQLVDGMHGWPALLALGAADAKDLARTAVRRPGVVGVRRRLPPLGGHRAAARDRRRAAPWKLDARAAHGVGVRRDPRPPGLRADPRAAGASRACWTTSATAGSGFTRCCARTSSLSWRAHEPEVIPERHRRAAIWLEARGAIDEAVEHAFASGDLDLAASMVGRALVPDHWGSRHLAARQWLGRFRDDELAGRPWLAVDGAWQELHGATSHGRSASPGSRIAARSTARRPTGRRRSTWAARCCAPRCAGAGPRTRSPTRCGPSSWIVRAAAGATWPCGRSRSRGRRSATPPARTRPSPSRSRARTRTGTPGSPWCLLGHRALLAADRLDWAAAEAFLDEGHALTPPAITDAFASATPALAATARLRAHQGHVTEAHEVLRQALVVRPALTAASPVLSVVSLTGLARAHIAVADAPTAAILLAQGAVDPAAPAEARRAGGGRDRAPRVAHVDAADARARGGVADDGGAARAGAPAVLPLVQGDRAAPGCEGDDGQVACPRDLREARRLIAQRGGRARRRSGVRSTASTARSRTSVRRPRVPPPGTTRTAASVVRILSSFLISHSTTISSDATRIADAPLLDREVDGPDRIRLSSPSSDVTTVAMIARPAT